MGGRKTLVKFRAVERNIDYCYARKLHRKRIELLRSRAILNTRTRAYTRAQHGQRRRENVCARARGPDYSVRDELVAPASTSGQLTEKASARRDRCLLAFSCVKLITS